MSDSEKIVNVIRFTSNGKNNSLLEVVHAKSNGQFTFASQKKGKMLIAYFYTPEGYSFATADLRYGPVTLRVSSYAKKYTTKVELIEKIVEYMRKTNFKDLATDSEISESIKTIPEFEESSKVNFDSIPA